MTASGSPAVSMLWETVDPYAALDRRFAFARPEDAADWLRATVATHWRIAVRRCERIVLSAGNALAWLDTDAGKLVAKWSVVPGLHPPPSRAGRTHRLVAPARPSRFAAPRDPRRQPASCDTEGVSRPPAGQGWRAARPGRPGTSARGWLCPGRIPRCAGRVPGLASS